MYEITLGGRVEFVTWIRVRTGKYKISFYENSGILNKFYIKDLDGLL